MKPLNLAATNDDYTAGVRYILDLETGHLAMDAQALFIASDLETLRYWLTPSVARENPTVVEPTTELAAEQTNTGTETDASTENSDTSSEQTDHTNDAEHDTPDHRDHTSVITRIKKRARANGKVTGRRVMRRRNPTGRSIL